MPRKENSQGFAHLGMIIAILVVIAAIALAGWYVWQNNREDNGQANTSQNSQGQDEQQNDPSEDGKYLVIEEWGVKIPLSSDISEAYYIMDDQGDEEYARLYDRAMDQMKNADGETCDGDKAHNIFVIGRIPKSLLDGPYGEDYRNQGFRQHDFEQSFAFTGVGFHQAPPVCASLKSGELDENIENAAYEKKLYFTEAFKDFQAE